MRYCVLVRGEMWEGLCIGEVMRLCEGLCIGEG